MRSRLYVGLGVVLGVAMAAALLERPELLLPVVVVGGAAVVWGTVQTYLPGSRRRERFTVVRGFFLALPTTPPGLNTVLGLMSVGALAALAVQERRIDGELAGLLLAATITLAVPIGVQVFLAWQPLYVALTPQGVVWRSAWHRRLVPWDALVPGGPPVPGPLAAKLTLEVARPEAVTIQGVGLFAGSARRPVITGQFDVHPRLMAGAIRWYVEHPQDRSAIGTGEEHQRLLTSYGRAAEGGPNR